MLHEVRETRLSLRQFRDLLPEVEVAAYSDKPLQYLPRTVRYNEVFFRPSNFSSQLNSFHPNKKNSLLQAVFLFVGAIGLEPTA
jgi:hypothetical protein